MAELLNEDAQKVVNELEKCRQQYQSNFEKQTAMLQNLMIQLVNEPIQEAEAKKSKGEDPGQLELSVTAQCLIESEVSKVQGMMDGLVKNHRGYHKIVSRCGKDLQKSFEPNLSGLLKNEKFIENNVADKQQVNKLIYEFLLDKGMMDVASTLKKEAELPIESSKDKSTNDIQLVMKQFRKKNLVPIMEMLEEAEYGDEIESKTILFEIYKQHMLMLLEKGKKSEAVLFGKKKVQTLGPGFAKDIAHLMGAVVSYPNLSERYNDIFHPNNWQVLESRIIKLISGNDSPLETLLTVGANAMSPMLSIKNLLSRSSLLNNDELPVSITIPNPVHSTFTCPILKTQSSESNPPMRLGCGHVISRDAVQKLTSSRPSTRVRVSRHNNRMKCPYCPEEINTHENKRLYFN